MGLLGRLKELTAPGSPPLPDGDEIPPWLREAAPQAFGPAGQAGVTAADAVSPDPYRRAPPRGAVPNAPPSPPPAYSPPPIAPTQGPPPPAPTAARQQAPAPSPAAPPAQRPWYANTLPPGQEGGPVPWFARQQTAPAAPTSAPDVRPPPPPVVTPQVATPPRSYTPPSPAPAAYSPPRTAPAQPSVAQVVSRLTDVVLENWRTYPLDAETLSLLQIGLPYLTQRDCSRDAILAGQTAARLGYVARAAEYAEFTGARETDGDLFDELSESLAEADSAGSSIANAMAEFAADLALSEPIDPPASDSGPSWVVPGVGGSVRGRLRDALLKGVRCPRDITAQDLQHTWKYGYFLRSMEEFFFDED
jgi:hypothetical protein